ncbi:TetR/AcrR family transcriptional regulator [Ornithinimicrobium faecis]|uniref:TetR/AcrR family transcriptional regulator n=1 Tax=Ornithinimicrobium faecis TaxID=2934158 RepID=A0ABY4YX41_9MICO|nr:TetR/AcrR family transcriptional regulator [Ornithinimicrobium sp. HY1793]USQ81299.1 TetR/AcrR family transcriptional regulator [Ornithinimicrobium sp. HY1793]
MTAAGDARVSPGREALFRSAAELFAVKGFHGTGMADLERATGMGRGSIYHHVSSKDDLLFGITTEYLRRLIDAGHELLGEERQAADRLREFSRLVVREIVDHLPEMTVCFRDLHAVQETRRGEVLDLHRAYEQTWADILQRGVDEGAFGPSTSRPIVVKALLGLHHYAYIWLRPDGPLGPDEVADQFVNLVLEGIRAA